jgi:malate dehydrogenase (oxaloacetate-decarboxylating)
MPGHLPATRVGGAAPAPGNVTRAPPGHGGSGTTHYGRPVDDFQARWPLPGGGALARPDQNKDAAFTPDEREALGLRGLLPWRTLTIEQQVALELERLRGKCDDVERYIGLAALHDRNETLFHKLLLDHLEELAPIVYTPTVGEACLRFSHIARRPRGVWVTPDDVDRIPQLLHNAGRPRVRLVVATDNERILGLGDLGAGGMGIPVGKLALYAVGGGIRPDQTLPVSLDCGTDNQELLEDPLYLGYPHRRLRGADYDRFVEAFVTAVQNVYPDAILQWEDFKQYNAIRLLDRYRNRIPSFNDDIQGTAAVVVAGILAALRASQAPLSGQRLVFAGAGAAGTGIAQLVTDLMREQGIPEVDSRRAIVMLDSRGLLYDGRDRVGDEKRRFALSPEALRGYGFEPGGEYDLDTVVRRVRPTILIGTTGQSGSFTELAIREMAAHTPVPIVFALSNPTANAEASPADVLEWSQGRALVATGSPFPPVVSDGRTRLVGQANNMFIFPGVGLGAIATRTREITDRMFLLAAGALAELVPRQRLASGALYPSLADLRRVSRAIAIAVGHEAQRSGLARLEPGTDVETAVDDTMWAPDY